jgi:hypothetical protein
VFFDVPFIKKNLVLVLIVMIRDVISKIIFLVLIIII